MANERDDAERSEDRRSDPRGSGPGGDGRDHGPLSGLSPEEFVRQARKRRGLDPELPPDETPEASGWTTGTTGPADPADPAVAATAESADQTDPTDTAGTAETAETASGSEASPSEERPSERDGPATDAPSSGTTSARSGPDRGTWHWPASAPRMDGFEPGVGAVVAALQRLEDPQELDDPGLKDRVADLVRLNSLVASAITAHVRVWDANCLWGDDRSKSPSARMAREANCAKSTASSWVELGRALARMPATATALDDGRISLDHARRLVRACTDDRLDAFLDAEEDLIGRAVQLAGNFAGFAKAVTVWEQYTDDQLHDPTDPDDLPKGTKKQKNGRHCTMRETDDGGEVLASLPKAGWEIVRTQLQRIVDELWRQDWNEARARLGEGAVICEADLGRTNRQRWADALIEMARRAGACKPGDVLPKPLITVHVTAADMTGPIRETFTGLVMSRRDVADLIADEADWERIIYAPGGQPTNLTSRQRNFTGVLRRAVQLRDRVCSHPTCDVDGERCQVDHIVEYADGGPTNIENARLLCPKHNFQRPGRGKTPRGGGHDGDGDPDGDGAEAGADDGDSDSDSDSDSDEA